MFDQRVVHTDQFTVTQKARRSTDIFCTIVGAIFALTLFILACVFWNQGNYDRLNGLTNQKGELCTKLLSFPDLNDLSIKKCVDNCPPGTGEAESYFGKTCLPADQSARKKLLESPIVTKPWDRQQFRCTIFYSFLIAIGVGLIWMTIVHCLPKYAPICAFVGAVLFLIGIGVLLLVDNTGFWKGADPLKIILASFCFLLAIILIVMLCGYSNQVKFQGIFLDYASRFLTQNPSTFAYIFIFLLFAAGLLALVTWQAFAFSSAFGKVLGFSDGGLLAVLNILEFIWGMQFLRDACNFEHILVNFCVSGVAVDYYWNKTNNCYTPYSRLVCKHWGSVVGGSFLNAFFQIPTLLVELIVCHPQTCCAKLGTFCYNSCSCCTCFFDLVRTDAYSYIHLSGIPFCDSAQKCKKICDKSRHFIGTYSAMKHYRFAAHILCVAVTFLACYFVLRYRVPNYNIWQVGILVAFIYVCVTFFVQIHSDAAQGLQTCFLSEKTLQNDYQYMQRCLPSIRKQLQHLEKRGISDGHC